MAEKNLFDDLDPVEGPAEIVSEETQVAAPSANLFDDIDPQNKVLKLNPNKVSSSPLLGALALGSWTLHKAL